MKLLTKPLTFLILSFPFLSLAQTQTPNVVYCVDALDVETYSVVPSDPDNNFSWTCDIPEVEFENPNSVTTTIDWTGFAIGTYILTFTEESSILPECSSNKEFVVSIVEGVIIDPIVSVKVCEFSSEVTISAIDLGSSFTYDWGQTTIDSSYSETLNLSVVGQGYDGSEISSNLTLNQSLTVYDENCSNTITFDVIIVNTPNPGPITTIQ